MNGGLIQPQNEHRSAVDDAKTELCEEAGNENQKPGIDDTEMKTMDCANSDVDVAPASLKVTTDGVLDNNVPSNTESQALLERHVTDPESKSCSEVQMKESNDVVGSAELKHSEDEHCMRKSQNDQKLELKESKSCSEVQMKELNDVLSSGELKPSEEEHCMTKSPNDQKLELKQVMGHVEMEQTETCAKSGLKEATNDDMHSEVSNPNMSPKNVTSSSQLGVVGVNHGGCGEITSVCCRSSFAEESLCTDNLEPVNKACVVLEIPKHVRPTGIRKITFKFSKRDVGHDGDLSTDVKPFDDGNIHEGFYDNHVSMSPTAHLMGDAFQNQGWSALEHEEMSLSMDGLDFQHTQSPSYCVPNRELKMSKKIVLDNYPTNVKKLLSTRILEGASVKYISISGMKELEGIVKDGGYLCGCYICNFSKVVNAHEFELHAGVKTRHPNNHIYLENGKSITSIVKELKSAPLSTVDSVIKDVAGSSVNEEYFKVWKENLQNGNGVAYAGSVYQSRHFGMPYCTSSHFTEESPYPALYQYSHVNPFNQSSYIELPVEKKRLVKKPRKNSSNSFGEKKKAGEGGNRKRDNDLHKLLFMPNGLPDGTSLAYYSKGKKILGGHKQGNGIFCTCCNCEISPSQFEAHAGWSAKRQPYRHIYTSSGLTLHDIALMLANGQNITSSGSDDMCAVCGNRGELIICNACPRAFHADCLGLQYPPDDDWHCQYCTERFGPGRKALAESRHIILRLKRVVKAPEFEPGGCVICRSQDFSAAKFDDRTVIICDQCEKEYHVGCLRESGFCDLKELPEDKWFCRNECHNIFKTLENMSCSAPEVIPASVLDAVYEKQTKIGFNTTSKNEIQWCILNGKSRCPEHILLLSRAAAIFRECFDPIVVKSGRDLIPVMVYGRNISGQEFSGMYCVVLIVQSVVVSAALLRIFGRDVAELPLVATARENQGKGYFQALFTCIEGLLSSMSVKHLVLPAAEEAEPMWTNKLGFSKTSNEQMLRYRDFQLTVFKGTCLLEKEVQQFQN